jgi:hypothetical protein
LDLVDDEDFWHMDVRLLLETDDWARIYVQYHGFLVLSEAMRGALAGGTTTNYGNGYFMIQPPSALWGDGDPTPHQACAWLLAIFRKLTATWHTRVFQQSPSLPQFRRRKRRDEL